MSLSVIIPVLNEQERINEIVRHLYQGPEKTFDSSPDPNPEIIIVDGDSAGSTLTAIKDQRVVMLVAARGRGNQLAAGAAAAGGDILLLLHADTRLPENACASILQAAAQGADWGAFRLGIDASPLPYRIVELAVDLRCRLFKLPYGDQAMFVTRAALSAVGGIPHIPLMEDVELACRLKRVGCRFVLLDDRISTSSRRWRKDGVVRRTLKNWWLLLRYLGGVKPELLEKEYR